MKFPPLPPKQNKTKLGENVWAVNQVTDIQNRILSDEIKIYKVTKNNLHLFLSSNERI